MRARLVRFVSVLLWAFCLVVGVEIWLHTWGVGTLGRIEAHLEAAVWPQKECRVQNTRLVTEDPANRDLVFGLVSPPGQDAFAHVWAEQHGANGQVLDLVAPARWPRHIWGRARLDADPIVVTLEDSSAQAMEQRDWLARYLRGFLARPVVLARL